MNTKRFCIQNNNAFKVNKCLTVYLDFTTQTANNCFLTSAKEVMWQPAFVFVSKITKGYELILMTFSEIVLNSLTESSLNFVEVLVSGGTLTFHRSKPRGNLPNLLLYNLELLLLIYTLHYWCKSQYVGKMTCLAEVCPLRVIFSSSFCNSCLPAANLCTQYHNSEQKILHLFISFF